MERFIRRGWTTGMAQESNLCGIFPCLLFWFVRNTTAYCLGPNRLPFPQLKSSMIQPSFNWHSHLNFESLKTKYICTVSQKSWMNRWLGSYSSRIGQIHWPTLLLPIHWMNSNLHHEKWPQRSLRIAFLVLNESLFLTRSFKTMAFEAAEAASLSSLPSRLKCCGLRMSRKISRGIWDQYCKTFLLQLMVPLVTDRFLMRGPRRLRLVHTTKILLRPATNARVAINWKFFYFYCRIDEVRMSLEVISS